MLQILGNKVLIDLTGDINIQKGRSQKIENSDFNPTPLSPMSHILAFHRQKSIEVSAFARPSLPSGANVLFVCPFKGPKFYGFSKKPTYFGHPISFIFDDAIIIENKEYIHNICHNFDPSLVRPPCFS